jgi:hypothetical protein
VKGFRGGREAGYRICSSRLVVRPGRDDDQVVYTWCYFKVSAWTGHCVCVA